MALTKMALTKARYVKPAPVGRSIGNWRALAHERHFAGTSPMALTFCGRTIRENWIGATAGEFKDVGCSVCQRARKADERAGA
jgi:hypothetical protein